MKRGQPKRAKPLRPDPEKVREFLQRSRKPLARPERPLARSELRPGRRKPARAPAAADGPDAGALTPAQWRVAVWEADEGCCCGCGVAVPRDADRWVWQAHHPLLKQTMKRRGLGHLVHHPDWGIVLCRRCHEGHHAISPVPYVRLPQRVVHAVTQAGTWAVDLVDRAHPGRVG